MGGCSSSGLKMGGYWPGGMRMGGYSMGEINGCLFLVLGT